MNKKYFIRIDDFIPGMDNKVLENIINFFKKNKIKPLIAIIPFSEIEDKDFWLKIKELQKVGWIIGLHGFDHKLRKNQNGTKSIVPIQDYSEFVGLSYNEQREKIKKGLEIFNKYGIKTDIFIAPAHGFDKTTLKVLKEFDFKYISDGFFLYPKIISGLKFLPQQLWQFRKIILGYKTICLHLEDFTDLDNKNLKSIEKNLEKFDNFEKLLSIKNENFFQKILNIIFEKLWFLLLKIIRG